MDELHELVMERPRTTSSRAPAPSRWSTRCAPRAIPIAVASNSPRAFLDRVLRHRRGRRRFAHTVAGDEVEHPKPAPDIYLEACRRLQRRPRRARRPGGLADRRPGRPRGGAIVIGVPYLPDMESRRADLIAPASLADARRPRAVGLVPCQPVIAARRRLLRCGGPVLRQPRRHPLGRAGRSGSSASALPDDPLAGVLQRAARRLPDRADPVQADLGRLHRRLRLQQRRARARRRRHQAVPGQDVDPELDLLGVAAAFFVEFGFDAVDGRVHPAFAFTQGVFPKPPDFSNLDAFDL